MLAAAVRIPIVAQHVDPLTAGAHTGYLVPESIRAAGAHGSLLNHSEHPLPRSTLETAVRRLTALDLTPIVCARDADDSASLAELHPRFLAVEPPELIGTGISVSTARPEVVSDSVERVRRVSPETAVLCGAGVTNGVDVRRALQLGASGVLVASAVAAVDDPKRALKDLLAGFG